MENKMAEIIEEKKKDEDWMQKKWRPAMGWMYMVVCFCDMVLFPVAWALLQAALKQPVTQWNPLTLQGAGLFHLAMGAVLGIAAWGRTQEKVAGAANNAPTPTLPPSMPTTPSVPAPVPMASTSMPRPIMAPPPAPTMDLLPDDPPTRNTRND
jgi:hypothetical protein